MNDTVIIAIISAGLSALINCIFQLVNKLIDNSKERCKKNNTELEEYKKKKEQVYIAAIGRLLEIRRGFEFTREQVIMDVKMMDDIKKKSAAFAEISPQLRLYAPNSIFNEYYKLATYSRFAYAPRNGPRLIENSKWAFDTSITILAQLMQEDLGYRKLTSEYVPIVCPNCHTEHDIYSVCPSCKMKYGELKVKLQELLAQVSESDGNQDDKS